MSAADQNAAPTGRSGKPAVLWLVAGSLWLLLPLLGIGFLGWAGFVLIGLLARRAAWLSAGGLYLVVLVISLFMNEEAGRTARLLIWAISSLHALGVNQVWLRNRWAEASGSTGSVWTALLRKSAADSALDSTTAMPTVRALLRRRSGAAPVTRDPAPALAPAPGRGFAPGPAGPAAELLNAPGLDAAGYYAGTAASRTAASSSRPPEPVDVNSASAAALQKLPGLSRHKARKAVRLRKERGPFRSVEDFCASLAVPGPELARLRPLIACKLPPAQPVSFGRSVDY
ncbi:helix-hairpin-helix domain-containing protein [Arthrobacter sp. NPDC089319]|uniref:ComEA family DNA-binding protein n=1 Tax=Arthrobacter sp. NPDC089319 TaxID=3155915 RepID=UPI00343C873F